MTTRRALSETPYAGNPHVLFDEGEIAPAATPRRGFPLYKKLQIMIGAACVLMACAATAEADTVRKPKALVIMLDGMRADAVENAYAPNMRMLRDGRWQPGYKCAWSMNAHTIYDAAALSGPNHVAIACGVTSKKSTVVNNGKSKCDFGKWPSWLVRAVSAKPELKALFMFAWDWDSQLSPDPRVEFVHGSDEANAAAMPMRLAAPDAPDAVMWYIDWPDHGGHIYGYYPYTIGYLNTVYLSDRAIGDALKAIASRPTFAQEDWLVIVTADHGGYARSHGAFGGHSETIPFLMSGRNVPQGKMSGIPRNYDVAPTVLAHFGIDSSGFGLDGKAVVADVSVDAKRGLGDGLAVHLPFEGKMPASLANAASGNVEAAPRGNVSTPERGGFIGGCLHLTTSTNGTGSVCLKGSENLDFENGAEFAMTMWVRMDGAQVGDPAIVANKNWRNGRNPGVLITVKGKGGVSFNAGMKDPPDCSRLDVGSCYIESGAWTFYAVARGADGVLSFYHGGRDGFLYRIAYGANDIRLKTDYPFFLGQDGTGRYTYAFNGDIDDFALWTRSLSHDDVRKIYEAGRMGISLGDLVNTCD